MKNSTKQKSGYEVPQDYFEHFEKRLLEKITEKKPVRKIILPTKKQATFWAAAAVVLMLGLFSLFKRPAPLQMEEDTFEYATVDVQPEDIDVFLDAQMVHIDESEIIDMIASNDDFEAMGL